MMACLDSVLSPQLEARRNQELYRQRLTLTSPQSVMVDVDGEQLLAFCSNDYLGLANDPVVKAGLQKGVETYGVGGGASHLVSGHFKPHRELEEALAEFTGRDRALLFSTGYMANLGVINALLEREDAVFQDRLNHASLLDGGLLSQARFQRYRHNDPTSLDYYLSKSKGRRKLVVTDGVFSMDGDIASLPALAESAMRQDAWLMVDDAHGFGVLGPHGAGTSEHFSLGVKQLPILMCTLGKALGTAGAFIAGSNALIEYLIQFSRSYIYTTATPPALVMATLASLNRVKEDSWRRDKLQYLISFFRRGAKALGLKLLDSSTPIQPIILGDASEAVWASQRLRQQGILVPAIREPTVPVGSARLRVTLSAIHTETQVCRLLDGLEQIYYSSGEKYGR